MTGNGGKIERRGNERVFDYFVLGILAILFVIIIEVMAREAIKPEVLTVLGATLGGVGTAIALAAQHLWGAPKKQADASLRVQAEPTVSPSPEPKAEGVT